MLVVAVLFTDPSTGQPREGSDSIGAGAITGSWCPACQSCMLIRYRLPLPDYCSLVDGMLIGYARCSTHGQDLRQALAACRAGDTLIVAKMDRPGRSRTDSG